MRKSSQTTQVFVAWVNVLATGVTHCMSQFNSQFDNHAVFKIVCDIITLSLQNAYALGIPVTTHNAYFVSL